MIFATGDTHGGFQRFQKEHFSEQERMTRSDYIIICGDFGGVWDGSLEEQRKLDRLSRLPVTILFVDGNHENFDILNDLPAEAWHGGRIHRIRPNVLHLMRGQVFDIDGCTFFTMGGASSHDIEGGILNPESPSFERRYWALRRMGARFRVDHISWWGEELPAQEEYATARANLDRVDWRVDYVITHCAPTGVANVIGKGSYLPDRLTDFLEEVSQKLKFHYWLFGHYHDNHNIGEKYVLLWEQIVRII